MSPIGTRREGRVCYCDSNLPILSILAMLAWGEMAGLRMGLALVSTVVTPGPCPAHLQSLWMTTPIVEAPFL